MSARIAKALLFFFTGALMYWIPGMFLVVGMESLCHFHEFHQYVCPTLKVVLDVCSIIVLVTGYYFKTCYRAGKWLWSLFVPAWRTA